MNYVYKKVKVAKPHCPQCQEMLRGNGSIASPYQCKCGVWQFNYNSGEFDVISHKDYVWGEFIKQ